MGQWFYLVPDSSSDGEYQRKGPASDFELSEQLRNGILPPDTLVWTEEMSDWAPASSVPALQLTFSTPALPRNQAVMQPPPLDDAEDIPDVPQIRPWVRYWARLVDIMVFSMLFGFLIGFMAPSALELNDTVFTIITILVYMFVEPIMLCSWGTTPGKALLRVRLKKRDGGKMTYAEALTRSAKVWIKGFGLGVPIVSLITLLTAYNKLTKDGITSWDAEDGYIVSHRRISAGRVVLTVVFFFVVFCLITLAEVAGTMNAAGTN